ncbi:MAG: HAMP domain-containing sensor histidine kinase [Planctomycetota bacterium]
MPRGLLLALLLLVAAPLVLLGWLSANAVQSSRREARENLSALLATQLFNADQRVSGQFQDYAECVNEVLTASNDDPIGILREMRRGDPIVRQGIVVDREGRIAYPGAGDLVGIDAIEVGAALPAMIDARPLGREENVTAKTSKASPQQPSPQQRSPLQSANLPAQQVDSQPVQWSERWAWQPWYMGDGAQVIFWRGRSDGSSIGILLERSRWMADVIAVLPDDTQPKNNDTPTDFPTIALFDETNRLIYRWGDDKLDDANLLVQKPLSSPLSSWELRLYSDAKLVPSGGQLTMVVSLGGVGVVLLSIGAYVLTTVQRQIQNAKSRVSFAGQVSHELRTPLTNIRLYTELAEGDLNGIESCETKDKLSKRLTVIDHESRRLQRLVSGVLEMIRPTGRPVGVRLQETDILELLEKITAQFEPSFAAAGLTLNLRCDVTTSQRLDPDVIEMVLVNLLSNVEKYVPSGGGCWVNCELTHDNRALRFCVEDDGPGIKPMHADRVFRPFIRLDDSISAPSGTGIGLTIARRAAVRHGADLRLMKHSDHGGAGFELTVPVDSGLEDRRDS